MPTEYTREIRRILNHPWKRQMIFQDEVRWNKIWASLDTFDDTQEAICYYLNLEEFGPYNGGYLFTYGILQAINLQQDALNNLLSALFDKTIDWKMKHPELYKIREQRNDSVGHPSSRRNDKSFHIIGSSSISKNGFTLASYFPETGEKSKFEKINIIKSIEFQSNLLKEIISDAMNELKEEFESHKTTFKGVRIKDVVLNTYDDGISGIFEHYHKNRPIAKISLETVKETISKIKREIEKRYFRINALPGTEDTLKQLECIIDRLDTTLTQGEIEDENELRILKETLQSHSEDFFKMIEEIDSEFE